MVLKRIIRSFLAVAGLFGALMSQPAHAVIYDVSLGGTMTGIRFGSFGALPSQVGQHLQSGNVLSAEFTFDVTGNTINAVSGSVTFDGASGNVTAFGSNSGGTGFRGFVVRFDELADGSSNVGDVSIDDMDFRITASSGQAVEDMFESALSNASAIFRSSVVATFRNSSGGTSFHRGQLDNDGTLSTQNVALAATVPVPAGFLLMMTGLIGLGVILRNGNAPLRNSVTA